MKTATKQRKHLHTFLTQKNIPFKSLDFGVQIDRKYYNYDTFKYFQIFNMDETFIINY